MNKDFLPSIYQEMASTKSKEDYQNDFIGPMLNYRNEIQWIINYIRKTLKEIDFRSGFPLSKEDSKKLKSCRRERREQLDILNFCELNIKQETNNLFNAVAGSIDQKWNDDDLIKIEGFQGHKLAKLIDKPIPLPIQSIIYILSARYCLLTKCAINAMILKFDVLRICNNSNTLIQEKLDEIKEDIKQIGKKRRRDNRILTQKEIAKGIQKAFDIYYAQNPYEFHVNTPGVPTIVNILGNWTKYLKASEEDRREMSEYTPYPEYEDILIGNESLVIVWACKHFVPRYIKEMKELQEKKDEKRKMKAEQRKKKTKKEKDDAEIEGIKATDAFNRLTFSIDQKTKGNGSYLDKYASSDNDDVFFDEDS